MIKRGKKYKKAMEFLKEGMTYPVDEAIELLEKTNTVKFDPTVEVHFNLNLDPKYQDQMIRTTITLPNGSGKTPKICVFSDGSTPNDELKKLWADTVWDEELITEIEKGNVSPDFDVCVAAPSMMRHLWKIARILWPKWLMPNPKTGTVWPDLAAIVKEIAAWKFEFKTDKQGNIHSIFGKLSFGKDKLKQNLEYFLNTIHEVKPTWAKGKYINNVFVCNAMWPSVKLNLNKDEK